MKRTSVYFLAVFLMMPAAVWAAHAQHRVAHTVECDGSLCAGEKQAPSAQSARLTATDSLELAGFRPPVAHPIVTSPYGERFNPILRRRVLHCGIDYGSPSGTPVYAAQDGVVELASVQNHLGIFVRMRHGRRIETLYAHLHRFMPGLRTGSVLRRGDIVGFVGESGFATGPHLHYEIIVAGTPINPAGGNMGNTFKVAALK